jgi:hypothetical protein
MLDIIASLTLHRTTYREGIEIDYEQEVTVSGCVQPADPSSGLGEPYVDDIIAHDLDGIEVDLSQREEERAVQALRDRAGL